jgi:hypothetical protein
VCGIIGIATLIGGSTIGVTALAVPPRPAAELTPLEGRPGAVVLVMLTPPAAAF